MKNDINALRSANRRLMVTQCDNLFGTGYSKTFSKFFLILSSFFLFSCGESKKEESAEVNEPKKKPVVIVDFKKIELRDVYFMEGTWMDGSGTFPGFHEKWIIQGDSLVQVIGYYVTGKDTMISEAIKVKMVNDTLHYIPKVAKQNNGEEVPFGLSTGSTKDSLVFANYGHDFPREIIYVKKGKDVVAVYLRGIGKKEEPRKYILRLNRISASGK